MTVLNRVILKFRALQDGKNTREYWEKRYENLDSIGRGSKGKNLIYKKFYLRNIINHFNIETILDVGCGELNYFVPFNNLNFTGVDVSKIALAKNKIQFPKLKFYTLEEFEPIDSKFDLVVSSEVIFCLQTVELNEHLKLLDARSSKLILIFTYPKHSLFRTPYRPNLKWKPPTTWQLINFIPAPKGVTKALSIYLFPKKSRVSKYD